MWSRDSETCAHLYSVCNNNLVNHPHAILPHVTQGTLSEALNWCIINWKNKHIKYVVGGWMNVKMRLEADHPQLKRI